MSTFMAKKEDVVRKWYVIDAAGKPLGKTAVAAADILRGKVKPDYTPHVDTGDFVIVINATNYHCPREAKMKLMIGEQL